MGQRIESFQNKYENRSLKKVVIGGFLLRVFVLFFILVIGTSFTEPYFILDDIKYEDTAQMYMAFANSVIDADYLESIETQYIRAFWPWVVSISAYIFKWVYAGRVINIILSSMCIVVIYKLALELSENKKTALLSAKLFAFLPLTVFVCCFPIKDIFITLAVMYAFYIFVCLQKGVKIKALSLVLCLVGLVCTYFTRGAVIELLAIYFFVFFIQKYVKKKKYFKVLLIVLVTVMMVYLFKDFIIQSFEEKIFYYYDYSGESGNMSAIEIKEISDFYKLPITYFFATLQPINVNLFSNTYSNLWYRVLTYLNITIYPVAIGNFLYIFQKKHNWVFWLSSLIMYVAVIILSLGVFRHYLFLLPLQLINYSLYMDKGQKTYKKFLVSIASLGLLGVVIVYSLLGA